MCKIYLQLLEFFFGGWLVFNDDLLASSFLHELFADSFKLIVLGVGVTGDLRVISAVLFLPSHRLSKFKVSGLLTLSYLS
jgi:hypothetical protein